MYVDVFLENLVELFNDITKTNFSTSGSSQIYLIMEICDSDEEENHPAKLHSKKNILYRLLMQKKAKGRCVSPEMKDSNLQTDLSDSPEKLSAHSIEEDSLTLNYIDNDEPTLALDDSIGNKLNDDDQMQRGISPNDCHNTNLALCCAITESSKSSSHPNSGYQRTCNAIENACGHNSTTDLCNVEEKKTRNGTTRKSTSLDEATEALRFEMCRLSSSRSPTPSEMSSGNSSPAGAPSSSQFRRRLLSQRLSADNLVVASSPASLRHSSPDSAKSMPEPRFQKRSISHDTMVPKKEQRHEEKKTNIDVNAKEKAMIASMESLAHNSLLAAQVLHLIPTTKARERNFLHGRIAANSLLGSFELERTLPNRELKIFVGTWNMNGQAPPKVLNDFMLPEGLEHVPDILAVGTQESFSERFEWEVSIQETVGPSHLLFHSAVLGTLHLAIFIRRDLLWFCSVPEEASYSVRPGLAFRTKGAVAIGFMLFGTSYLFITAHLTAHMDKAKERVHDVKRICRSLDLPKLLPNRHRSKDVTSNYDCVFWCGDLNFRLDQIREEVMQWVNKEEFPLATPHSLQNDQLTRIISDGSIFRGFEEGPIRFPPTYKFDPGTQNYDTSHKQRVPAYTDRILYKCRGRRESNPSGAGNLECLMYESVVSICTSDHKPVWGVYKSIVRPGIDTIPLAAGLFNREVFLEGIKRRAAAMNKLHDASSVCQIQ